MHKYKKYNKYGTQKELLRNIISEIGILEQAVYLKHITPRQEQNILEEMLAEINTAFKKKKKVDQIKKKYIIYGLHNHYKTKQILD